MTNETKVALGAIIASIILLAGGAWLYQINSSKSAPDVLTENQEALVRENSIKVAASSTEKLVVVEFADYQCPACSSIAPKVKELMEKYSDNVTFVYRNFPLTGIHKNAIISAQAARIAGEKGKYWEMHDILYEKRVDWENLQDPTDLFVTYATSLGIDATSFKQKISSDIYKKEINDDLADGKLLGVNGTPTFFVGNTIIRSSNYTALVSAIEAELAK